MAGKESNSALHLTGNARARVHGSFEVRSSSAIIQCQQETIMRFSPKSIMKLGLALCAWMLRGEAAHLGPEHRGQSDTHSSLRELVRDVSCFRILPVPYRGTRFQPLYDCMAP